MALTDRERLKRGPSWPRGFAALVAVAAGWRWTRPCRWSSWPGRRPTQPSPGGGRPRPAGGATRRAAALGQLLLSKAPPMAPPRSLPASTLAAAIRHAAGPGGPRELLGHLVPALRRGDAPGMVKLGRELEAARHPGKFRMVAVSVDESAGTWSGPSSPGPLPGLTPPSGVTMRSTGSDQRHGEPLVLRRPAGACDGATTSTRRATSSTRRPARRLPVSVRGLVGSRGKGVPGAANQSLTASLAGTGDYARRTAGG